MRILLFCWLFFLPLSSYCWGFYGHGKINYYAVFLLPPELLDFYKSHLDYLVKHATDPDMRRYVVVEEGARHFIDIDHYGEYPFDSLPRKWDDAVCAYTEDTLQRYGIVPWHVQRMEYRLTKAFMEKNLSAILRNSAELGHYVADAHVPLHASSNHNGQLTGQQGIHGFWESRVPELLAEKQFSFWVGKANYIPDVADFIWQRVLESAAAVDTVLRTEKYLNNITPADKKYATELRKGIWIKQYSTEYTIAYNHLLNGMIERRMRASIFAVASLWYTAWINAGQPNLKSINGQEISPSEQTEWNALNKAWRWGSKMLGQSCD